MSARAIYQEEAIFKKDAIIDAKTRAEEELRKDKGELTSQLSEAKAEIKAYNDAIHKHRLQGRADIENWQADIEHQRFSKRKFATLSERLIKDGVPRARLDAVQAPAGLDIGAITPEEIALSILAQVVAARRTSIRAGGEADSTQPRAVI